ncbi:MAG: hypothetical protein WCK46_01790 [Candidatus Adlerbacteria bacterium]
MTNIIERGISLIGRMRKNLEGKSLWLVFATIAFLAVVDVSPAFAIDCRPHGEHKVTFLSLKSDVFGWEDIDAPLRVTMEVCRVNKAGERIQLDEFAMPDILGVEETYTDRNQVDADLKLVMQSVKADKKFGPERLKAMVEKIKAIQDPKTADAKPAPCPPGQEKAYVGTGDEKCVAK